MAGGWGWGRLGRRPSAARQDVNPLLKKVAAAKERATWSGGGEDPGFYFFGGGAGADFVEVDAGWVEGGLGVFEFEALHGFDEDAGDGNVAVPLVVRRDDEPGGALLAGVGEDVFVGVDVLGPEGALFEVGGRELPALVGVVDAGLEAFGLFFAGEVEEELEDDGVVVVEALFEVDDLIEALVDGLFADVTVDAGGEDVFVVGAVEDADHAAGRDLGLAAPKEVVAELEGGGDFEGGDVATLGVDAGEDVADDAVFAGGVHTLKDDEDGFCL